MNYLAHLYLADDHPDAVLGCLMGDFIKGAIDTELPPVLRHAIVQHRQIDSFTDQHPVFRHSKSRISPGFRRYAGILIDMFYDHFLARGWDNYSDTPLPEYAKGVYAIIDDHPHPLPGRMPMAMQYMIRNDSLVRYGSLDGIQLALRGLETRLSRPSQLGDAVSELEHHYEALGDDFRQFFSELKRYVIDTTSAARQYDHPG